MNSLAIPPAVWLTAAPAVLALLYVLLLAFLAIPFVQRHLLYLHKINTCFYHDLHDPTTFGFAPRQVHPFSLKTAGGDLFAWHILPLSTYTTHRAKLISKDAIEPGTLIDSSSRAVIFLHGNAGHLAQNWRTDTYRSFSALPDTHVLALDYRGFGLSSGVPTEQGLIQDGIAAVEHVIAVWRIPPEKIVLVGHSLGSAVAAGVALALSGYRSDQALIPPVVAAMRKGRKPTFLAGVVLVAPFVSIPDLLMRGHVVPFFRPLAPFPVLKGLAFGLVKDTWRTRDRLVAYSDVEKDALSQPAKEVTGTVRIIHSQEDLSISFRQSAELWASLIKGRAAAVLDSVTRSKQASPRFEAQISNNSFVLELIPHGGHDRVCTYSVVSVAIRELLRMV